MGYAGETVVLTPIGTSTRICHMLKRGTGNSYCGKKPFAGNEHLAHDQEACSSAGHQVCEVCTCEHEHGVIETVLDKRLRVHIAERSPNHKYGRNMSAVRAAIVLCACGRDDWVRGNDDPISAEDTVTALGLWGFVEERVNARRN